jgi:hypothetical protein
MLMQSTCDYFFTASGFTGNEHRGLACCRTPDQPVMSTVASLAAARPINLRVSRIRSLRATNSPSPGTGFCRIVLLLEAKAAPSVFSTA